MSARGVKYQVFVSSTYTDLRTERDQVIKAVLEMGHIPVGMEMFSAADEEQWRLIARQIDQSDYYIVIVAHRYGSTLPDGLSYTEKEYDYAVRMGVPVLGFIIEEDAPWPGDRVDRDPNVQASLDSFKEKLRQKPVGLWKTAEDLHGKASIALMKEINTHPRPGWVRASEESGPEVLSELSRLSSENSRLRNELNDLHVQLSGIEERDRRQLLETLRKVRTRMSVMIRGAADWERVEDRSLLWVFSNIGPLIVTEGSVEEMAGLIGYLIAEKRPIRTPWPVPRNGMNAWLSDLMAFGLVQPSERRHSVKDSGQYYTLTEEGREVLSALRRRDVERRLESGADEEEPADEETADS